MDVFLATSESTSKFYVDVSENGGIQQPLVFLLKMIILGVLGVPPFKETPKFIRLQTFTSHLKTNNIP